MKRSEVLASMEWIITDNHEYPDDAALRVLSYLEDIGMQPPVCTVKLVEDKLRGGTKHSESIRKWDDEAE